MATMNTIHDRLGAMVCRRCINRSFHMRLEPSDCEYAMYPGPCCACGNVHNIVVNLRGSSKVKLLFAR